MTPHEIELATELDGCGHLPVSYDDEVTPQQVKKIDALVSPEFEGKHWETVESENKVES